MRGACVLVAVACVAITTGCKRDAHPHATAANAATVAHAATIASVTTTPPPGPPPPVAPLPAISGTFVLPGTLRADDSIDSLRKRFGAANVEAGDVPGAEETVRGVVLYPDDPTRRAYLYFEDAEQSRGLSLVRVLDAHSRWQLPSGVRMGMPLSEIVRRNGKRIQFTGFGWDYGGTISNWNNGHLQPLPGQGRFSLTERESLPESTSLPEGDQEIWSDDPKWPTMDADVVVGELVFGFPREADMPGDKAQSSKR